MDTEIAKIKAEESLEQQSTLMHSFYPMMMAAAAGVPDNTFKNVLKSKLVLVSAIQERTQPSQRLVAVSRAIEQIKGVAERQESTDVAWAALDTGMAASMGQPLFEVAEPDSHGHRVVIHGDGGHHHREVDEDRGHDIHCHAAVHRVQTPRLH